MATCCVYHSPHWYTLYMQAQAVLSTQLVVARQQHADVCMQLQKEHAALQQAVLQEHALQKVRPTRPLDLHLCLCAIAALARATQVLTCISGA